MDRCKIRATFAPTTFEDKERLQAHGNGIETQLPWDNLYQERKREITCAETNHDATAARLSCCWIDSIGDKLFVILKSLIILLILFLDQNLKTHTKPTACDFCTFVVVGANPL